MKLHVDSQNIAQAPKSFIPLSNKAAADIVREAGEKAMEEAKNSCRYARDTFTAGAADTVKPFIKNPEVFARKMPFLGKLVTKYIPTALAILAGYAAGTLINKAIDKIIANKQKKEG